MAYSPTMGRWMEQDPAGYVDGLNLYQFVGSNPVKYVDPMGTDRYISGVTFGHVGVAVDTWANLNGKWVKTGVSTFDFSVDWDSWLWPLGVVAWNGKVVETPGLTLDNPVTVQSTPYGDQKLLADLSRQVVSPPTYSLLGGLIGQYPNYCISWSEDEVQLYKDEQDPAATTAPATTASTRPCK